MFEAQIAEEPQVWRTDPALRVLVGLAIIVAAAGVPGSIIAGVHRVGNSPIGLWLFIAAWCAGTVVVLRRMVFHPLLRASTEGLYIQNVTDEHRIAWDEIAKITPGYYGLQIALTNGKSISASAVQKSNYATARGLTTRSETIAAIIADRASNSGRRTVTLPTPADRNEASRTARWVIVAGAALILARLALELA